MSADYYQLHFTVCHPTPYLFWTKTNTEIITISCRFSRLASEIGGHVCIKAKPLISLISLSK